MSSSAPFLPPFPATTTTTTTTAAGSWSFPNPITNSAAALFPQLPMPPPPNLPPDSALAKSLAASRTHREAERLRRKRINDHLSTLRTLLPNLLKTDKASLLTEAVRRLRELKEETSHLTAPSAADENLIPEDIDSVRVRRCEVNGGVLVATVSCEDRAELVSDVSRALKTVRGNVVRAEVATVGGRTKMVVRVEDGGGREGTAALSRALRAVIDRPTCTGYASTFGLFGPKRQRLHR